VCNACGYGCCASDEFEGCGCDSCDEPDCWTVCDPVNGIHGALCDCPFDEDGDYDGD
jgi:hypothetical protein